MKFFNKNIKIVFGQMQTNQVLIWHKAGKALAPGLKCATVLLLIRITILLQHHIQANC